MEIAHRTNGAPFVPFTDGRCYVIGRTGSGKSTLLFNMITAAIGRGDCIVLIDPDGDLALQVVDSIPPERTHEVCYLDPLDPHTPVFNPLHTTTLKAPLVAANLMSAIKAYFEDISWGPKLEWFLICAIALLVDKPHSVFSDITKLFTNEAFRERSIYFIKDEKVREFWTKEYPSYDKKYREDVGSILNKIGQFVLNPHVRACLCAYPTIDLSDIFEKQKILIVNLNEGLLGETPATILGSMLVSTIRTTAMARPIDKRFPIKIFADEFSALAPAPFVKMLSRGRKYGISLTLAHQFTEQLDTTTRAAILANVDTLITMNVSTQDAEILAPSYDRSFAPSALSDQPDYQAWVRQKLDYFPISTLPPQPSHQGRTRCVLNASRWAYGS